LASDDAIALYTAALALAFTGGDLPAGTDLINRALQINPNLAVAWDMSGYINVYKGEADRAVENFNRAMRLSPLDPLIYTMQSGMAAAHFQAARYDEAASWAGRALRAQPTWLAALRIAIAQQCAFRASG
jgi:tetratricopeptide (TPR) repeat protein